MSISHYLAKRQLLFTPNSTEKAVSHECSTQHSVAQIGAIVTASLSSLQSFLSVSWRTVTLNEDLPNTIFNEEKSCLHSAAQAQ